MALWPFNLTAPRPLDMRFPQVDYFENILVALDNFISRGTEVFLTCKQPDYLASASQVLRSSQHRISLLLVVSFKVSAVDVTPTQQPRTFGPVVGRVHGRQGGALQPVHLPASALVSSAHPACIRDPSRLNATASHVRPFQGRSFNQTNRTVQMAEKALTDDNLEDSDVVCAAKLLEIVLQNCRGRVDQVGRPTLTMHGSGARVLVHMQYTGVLAWRSTNVVEPG